MLLSNLHECKREIFRKLIFSQQEAFLKKTFYSTLCFALWIFSIPQLRCLFMHMSDYKAEHEVLLRCFCTILYLPYEPFAGNVTRGGGVEKNMIGEKVESFSSSQEQRRFSYFFKNVLDLLNWRMLCFACIWHFEKRKISYFVPC